MSTLKERVLIVNLSISQWNARKYDKSATKEVEANHQARDAGHFNKVLMHSDTLQKIGQVGNQLRSFTNTNTLPWSDNGDRILSTEKYFEFIANFSKMKMEFTKLVDQFILEYEEEKRKAKMKLNTLYNESDYPNSESLRTKFDLSVKFTPIADGTDLRVSMSDEVVNSIKSQITKDLEQRVHKATDSMLERLRAEVRYMIEVLTDKDRKFKDSLVNNIENVIMDLPLLNFNNDQKVIDACTWCRALLVDPERLRTQRKFRFEIADKAKQILENI